MRFKVSEQTTTWSAAFVGTDASPIRYFLISSLYLLPRSMRTFSPSACSQVCTDARQNTLIAKYAILSRSIVGVAAAEYVAQCAFRAVVATFVNFSRSGKSRFSLCDEPHHVVFAIGVEPMLTISAQNIVRDLM